MDHSERFLQLVKAAQASVTETTPSEVHARRQAGERLLVVDVREDNEWQKGRVVGALHLGKGIIERDIEKKVPDPTTEIILYCGGGFRSALAADALQRMGYTNVKSLTGGWKAWQQAGLPTE